MKRHPSLISLSHDHKSALFLARYLRNDSPEWKGYPNDPKSKRDFALISIKKNILPHFLLEESVFNPLVGTVSNELSDLINTMTGEHMLLRLHFLNIESSTDPSANVELLDKTGRILENHIRMEERQLFPLIEQSVSDETLLQIGKDLLEKHS